jgi:protein-disulfide isomerase
MGRTAGLTDEQVDACLQDADMAQAMVAVYQQNAAADGIESTPSFVINGEKYSNMTYEEFSAILEEKLGS